GRRTATAKLRGERIITPSMTACPPMTGFAISESRIRDQRGRRLFTSGSVGEGMASGYQLAPACALRERVRPTQESQSPCGQALAFDRRPGSDPPARALRLLSVLGLEPLDAALGVDEVGLAREEG